MLQQFQIQNKARRGTGQGALFDKTDYGWMFRCLEHRIADRRVLRLIRNWLPAGKSWTDENQGQTKDALPAMAGRDQEAERELHPVACGFGQRDRVFLAQIQGRFAVDQLLARRMGQALVFRRMVDLAIQPLPFGLHHFAHGVIGGVLRRMHHHRAVPFDRDGQLFGSLCACAF